MIAGIFLACLSAYATYQSMQSIGVSAIAGFMTILTSYILGETRRPSIKPKENSFKVIRPVPKLRKREQ